MKTKKKCCVAGAGGFIGGHLANYLESKGHDVVSCDVKVNPWQYVHNFVLADLRRKERCLQVTKDVDWVFQLAAVMGGIGFITETKADVMHDNVIINANMLEASVENGVERIFFSSSACVYPHQLQMDEKQVAALKESDAYPAQPALPYGWEKLFSEIMYKSFEEDYGLESRIARFHNVMGPYGSYVGGREKAPAALCRKVALAEDGDSIEVWGDGLQRRSFLYVGDCLEAVYRLMCSDYNESLNIGSDVEVTINELADMIIDVSGKRLSKTYDVSRPQGVRRRNCDLTLAKKVLDWYPQVSYSDGLTRIYRWIEGDLKKAQLIAKIQSVER